MKFTPFTEFHRAAGARMAEFAGYDMPIEFSGINDEHLAVRSAAGVFDVSHMGEIWVRGGRAEDFLQHVTSNDVAKLTDGKIQYTCLTLPTGGIVDDILLYRFGAGEYLLVVNASNTEKDFEHIRREAAAFEGVEVADDSENIAQLAVQGPLAMKIVQEICPAAVENMPYYTFMTTEVGGVPGAILSATGYTGSGGCEIYVRREDALKLWESLWQAGRKYGLKNIGLGARDTLRLEKGYCLYGNDIDETTTPLEAGLGWITRFTKDFIGRPVLERQQAEGVARRLVGFVMEDRGIPRHGYAIADASGRVIGHVTSGTMSPVLKQGIGMCYVESAYAAPGTGIFIVIRDKPVRATVVKPPFV